MKRFVIAFLVIGFSCTISQVLLIREFMTIIHGNELILGIIFVNWLLCIAIGSWGLGRLADKAIERLEWLVVTLILASIVLPVQILLVRSMGGWMAAERGEMVGIFSTFYFTFLALLPFCLLHGFQFTLCCKLYPRASSAGELSVQISRVYVFEALGSVMGGLAFTYILIHRLRVLEIGLGLSILNLSLALLLLQDGVVGPSSSTSKRLLTGITVLMIVLSGYAVSSGGLSGLDDASHRWQWKGFELVHSQNSIYGNIAITQSEEQLDFWVNGLPFFTTPDPDIEFVEEIVHIPMLQHPSPKSVLLIGGGLGGVLEEILKHPVDRVTYVEIDPLVIVLAKKYAQATSEVLDDPRVDVVHLDGRRYVKGTEDSFDVAIVNLPAPSTLQLNRFYTMEFFEEIHEILYEDGVLSIGLTSSLAHMSKEMAARNRCIHETIRRVFPSYLVVPGGYNIFLASPRGGEGDLTYDVGTLSQRLRDRGIETDLIMEDYLRYKFSPERMEMGLAYLYRNGGEINRDMKPVAVYHDLALWNTMLHPQTRVFFGLLSQVNFWWVIISLGPVILALVIVGRKLVLGRVPIYLAVFTTGFAGMTLSILMLYIFQAVCGYLYQELGVVAASFMFGLAMGGWFISRGTSKIEEGIPALFKIELAIIAYSLLIAATLAFFSFILTRVLFPSLMRGVLPLLNFAAGFFVGLEFPLASKICLGGEDRVAGVAGKLYASDLFGACTGSFISSIWLIPLHGVLGACMLAAAINVASFALLYNASRA